MATSERRASVTGSPASTVRRTSARRRSVSPLVFAETTLRRLRPRHGSRPSSTLAHQSPSAGVDRPRPHPCLADSSSWSPSRRPTLPPVGRLRGRQASPVRRCGCAAVVNDLGSLEWVTGRRRDRFASRCDRFAGFGKRVRGLRCRRRRTGGRSRRGRGAGNRSRGAVRWVHGPCVRNREGGRNRFLQDRGEVRRRVSRCVGGLLGDSWLGRALWWFRQAEPPRWLAGQRAGLEKTRVSWQADSPARASTSGERRRPTGPPQASVECVALPPSAPRRRRRRRPPPRRRRARPVGGARDIIWCGSPIRFRDASNPTRTPRGPPNIRQCRSQPRARARFRVAGNGVDGFAPARRTVRSWVLISTPVHSLAITWATG